ncbi:MAG TPA: hypothetical protein VM619_15680 [Luteimonas sp.]|nr:hypothetical protein [Luteimonas sp.]
MRPILLLPAWLLLCACAQAHALSQCKGQGGATAYREGDCLAGERLVARHEAVADPDSASAGIPVAAGRAATQAPATRRTHATRASVRGRPKRRKPSVDPCTREKRARDDFQRRRSIHVTMDELSRWNHRVYEACK